MSRALTGTRMRPGHEEQQNEGADEHDAKREGRAVADRPDEVDLVRGRASDVEAKRRVEVANPVDDVDGVAASGVGEGQEQAGEREAVRLGDGRDADDAVEAREVLLDPRAEIRRACLGDEVDVRVPKGGEVLLEVVDVDAIGIVLGQQLESGVAQLNAERGPGEHREHREARDDDEPRAPLDPRGESREEALVLGDVGRDGQDAPEATDARDEPRPLEAVAEEVGEGRHERHRDEQRHDDDAEGRAPERLHEVGDEGEHPADRNGDRHRGEEDGPARRGHGALNGVGPRVSEGGIGRRELLPVAGDDEEPVVDAQADPEHRDDALGGVVDGVGEREPVEDGEPPGDRGDRAGDRHGRGEEAPEHEHHDDEGERKGDDLADHEVLGDSGVEVLEQQAVRVRLKRRVRGDRPRRVEDLPELVGDGVVEREDGGVVVIRGEGDEDKGAVSVRRDEGASGGPGGGDLRVGERGPGDGAEGRHDERDAVGVRDRGERLVECRWRSRDRRGRSRGASR